MKRLLFAAALAAAFVIGPSLVPADLAGGGAAQARHYRVVHHRVAYHRVWHHRWHHRWHNQWRYQWSGVRGSCLARSQIITRDENRAIALSNCLMVRHHHWRGHRWHRWHRWHR